MINSFNISIPVFLLIGLVIGHPNITFISTLKSTKAGNLGCGLSSFGLESCSSQSSLRIVNGVRVKAGEIPWQVRETICFASGCFRCGGSILSAFWVLTAAHCVFSGHTEAKPEDVTVFAGQLRASSRIGQAIKCYKIISHQNYSPARNENDIALLQLSRSLIFNQFVATVCLPSQNNKFTEMHGWGTLSENGQSSNVLMKTVVKVTSNRDRICINGAERGNYPPRDTKMCAYNPGTDSCQGDSGGPLTTDENGRCSLIGVVSYGQGCARMNLPGVYARVTHYLGWIRSHANLNEENTTGTTCNLSCLGVQTGNYQYGRFIFSCSNGVCQIDDPNNDVCQFAC